MKHDDGGQEFVDRLLTACFAMVLALAVVATALAPWLMRVTTQLSGPALHLSILFAFLLLPEILFYGVYAVLGNVLNARGQFAAFMWSPALANVVQIVGLGAFLVQWGQVTDPSHWSQAMVWTLGGTMTVGILVQAAALVVPLVRGGFRYRPRFGLRGTGLGQASKMLGWTFTAVAIGQLGGLLVTKALTAVVNAHQHEHVAGLTVQTNALTLFYLPHSLITVSILTALFPQMARSWQEDDLPGLGRIIRRGLSTAGVGVIPASFALIAMAGPLVRVMAPGFSELAAHQAAVTLQIMALSTLAFGISTLQQRYSVARERGPEYLYFQLALTLVQIAFALLAWFVVPARLAVYTVAVGMVVSNGTVAVAFLVMAHRQLGTLKLGGVIRLWVRLLIASVLAAGTGWLVVHGMSGFGAGWLLSVLTCALTGVAFGLVFLAVSRILHIREVEDLLAPVLRRVHLA